MDNGDFELEAGNMMAPVLDMPQELESMCYENIMPEAYVNVDAGMMMPQTAVYGQNNFMYPVNAGIAYQHY